MGQNPQLVNKFPAFYRSPSFITLFTTACQWSLSRARSISYKHLDLISLIFNLMLSSHLCLSHLSSYFPSGFFTKTLQAFLFFPLWPTCPIPFYCPWFTHSNKFSMSQVKNCIFINTLTLVVVSLPCTNYKIKLIRETTLYTTESYKIYLVRTRLLSMCNVVGYLVDYIHRTGNYSNKKPLCHCSLQIMSIYWRWWQISIQNFMGAKRGWHYIRQHYIIVSLHINSSPPWITNMVTGQTFQMGARIVPYKIFQILYNGKSFTNNVTIHGK